jgi:hypothetical protein
VKVMLDGLAVWPEGAPICTRQLVPAAPTLNGIVWLEFASIMMPPPSEAQPEPLTLYVTISASPAGPPVRVTVAELEVFGARTNWGPEECDSAKLAADGLTTVEPQVTVMFPFGVTFISV